MRFHNGEIAVQERAQARNFADEVGEGIADFVTPGTKDFPSTKAHDRARNCHPRRQRLGFCDYRGTGFRPYSRHEHTIDTD
jgi:hypothetical protein